MSFVYLSSTLWENLRDEIQDPKEALQTSSDDETNDTNVFPEAAIFYLGRDTAKDLSSLHPSPVQIFRLWQTFLVNVNPLVKIFHAPTVQQIILDATGDLSHIPRATESLMFAIYLISVTSLRPEECETMFGETQPILISKYSQAAQQALINGKFLKSVNLYSLQAFCLYLVSYNLSSRWGPEYATSTSHHPRKNLELASGFFFPLLQFLTMTTTDIGACSLFFGQLAILSLYGSSLARLCAFLKDLVSTVMERTTRSAHLMLK